MSRHVHAVYRVRQFLQALGLGHPGPVTTQENLARHLPPAAATLFRRMPRYDRLHAVRVAGTLQIQGHADPDLLVAALLHDVGKTSSSDGRLRLWHRVAVVLMEAFRPGLVARVSRTQPSGWRRAFFVQEHHAAIGAELAGLAGCSPSAVELIRCHEARLPSDRPGDGRLAALQAADDEN